LPVPWQAWLLELLFPARCASCGVPGSVFCPVCSRLLVHLRPPLCSRCGAPTAWPVARCRECAGHRIAFASARSAVAYEGPARGFVRAWKEHGLRRAAEPAADLVAQIVARPTADVITYIPPDGARSRRRGYHPAEQLAAAIAARWGLASEPLLGRARPVARQTGLSLAERRANVRGAFTATRPPPRSVVLVDDVYTTGATVGAAATALQAAGAARVHVVTFARAVR